MSAHGGAGPGPWPDERQRLLLGAAFWEGERAISAWNHWRSISPVEEVGGAHTGLMAVAYRSLHELGADDPVLTLAAGIYRRTWYLNQVALRRAAAALARLRDASLDALLIGGAATLMLAYRDLGARGIERVDLLLGPGQLRAAVATLAADGWRAVEPMAPGRGLLSYMAELEDDTGKRIALHAYALRQSADDRDLWHARIPLDLLGVPAHAPALADQLLCGCAALPRSSSATPHWAADALAILRAAGDTFEWERLVARARARRLTAAVGESLSWLTESLDASVPGWVITRLAEGPRLHFERAVNRAAGSRPSRLRAAVLALDRYRRFALLAPVRERPHGLVDFLRHGWQLDTPRATLLHGGRKLLGRAG